MIRIVHRTSAVLAYLVFGLIAGLLQGAIAQLRAFSETQRPQQVVGGNPFWRPHATLNQEHLVAKGTLGSLESLTILLQAFNLAGRLVPMSDKTLASLQGASSPHKHVAHSPSRNQHVVAEEVTLEESEPLQIQTPSSSPEAERIKSELLKIGLLTLRGTRARETERMDAASLVEELERSAGDTSPVLRDGIWELVLSDIEPFRASTFFLALAHAVEDNIMSGASDGALTVHSLATGGGEVGRVAHVIEDGGSRLRSLVELQSGSLPSLPVALTGTVISSGRLTTDPTVGSVATPRYTLNLESTSVQDSKVRYGGPRDGSLRPGEDDSLLSWIGDQIVPSGDIFGQVLDPMGGGQQATLELSYADDNFMVWRAPKLGNHYFVMARGSEAAWPEMEEWRRREASATTSPIGSGFALGMLNPFFSRRMRQ